MKAIGAAVLAVVGVALFVWLVANPIADAIAMAHLRHLSLTVEADTDVPDVVAAANAARGDIVATLQSHGVQVSPDASRRDGSLELVLTVHGYDRCGDAASTRGVLLENVELRLCDPAPAGRPALAGTCVPRWSRATPLACVPRGAAPPVRDQVRELLAWFVEDEHLPTHPAVPFNPRHLGW